MSRIDDLRALHEAASTNGAEWHAHEWGESRRRPTPATEVWACLDPDHLEADGVATEHGVSPDAAAFIVTAHKVWPALLDVASAAERLLAAPPAFSSPARNALRAALDHLNAVGGAPATPPAGDPPQT